MKRVFTVLMGLLVLLVLFSACSSGKADISKTADIVIIGAGGAGMSAAVEAVNAGRSVIVVEKMAAVGGNTIRAGSAYNTFNPDTQRVEGMMPTEMTRLEEILAMDAHDATMQRWLDTLKQEVAEYKKNGSTYLFDSPTLHKIQTYMGGDYVGLPELIEIVCDNSLEGIQFLSSLGAEWQPRVNAAVGATWRRSHTPDAKKYGASGAAFVLPQVQYAQSKGVEIMLDSKADELIMENGRCVGVRGVNSDGKTFEVRAGKNVILASGGFGANIEMRQKYNKFWATLDESVPTTNQPGATGDGIVMAEKAGAALEGIEWIQLIPTYGYGVVTPYIENQIYVNKDGKRFVKEDGRRDELSQAILKERDAQIFIISDASTLQGGVLTVIERRKSAGQDVGWMFEANTLEELAGKINVPYENLKASVDQFNASRRSGQDPFGRRVFDKEFGTPPFHAGLTGPMVHHTMGGVRINTDCQVLDTNGNVIPGLYAAGEVTGGVHGTNRLGGNAIADITVMGRRAGQNASR